MSTFDPKRAGNVFTCSSTDADMFFILHEEDIDPDDQFRLMWITWKAGKPFVRGGHMTDKISSDSHFVCNLQDVFLEIKRKLEIGEIEL